MGMFDYVNVEIPCPHCSATMKGFESKDGYCLLETIDPDCVDNFYSQCQSCKKWVEYERKSLIIKARDKPFSLEEIENLGFEMVDKKQ